MTYDKKFNTFNPRGVCMSIIIVNAIIDLVSDSAFQRLSGAVELGGVKFDWIMNSDIELHEHPDFYKNNTLEDFRGAVHLQVKIADEELDLNDREWDLFYTFLFGNILQVYYKNVRRVPLQGERNRYFSKFESEATFTGTESVKVIVNPKFRCNLLVDIEMVDELVH